MASQSGLPQQQVNEIFATFSQNNPGNVNRKYND